MKYILILVCILFLFISCAPSGYAHYGLGTEDNKEDGVKYELDVTSVIMGVIFIETIVAPIVVLYDYMYVSTEPVEGW